MLRLRRGRSGGRSASRPRLLPGKPILLPRISRLIRGRVGVDDSLLVAAILIGLMAATAVQNAAVKLAAAATGVIIANDYLLMNLGSSNGNSRYKSGGSEARTGEQDAQPGGS